MPFNMIQKWWMLRPNWSRCPSNKIQLKPESLNSPKRKKEPIEELRMHKERLNSLRKCTLSKITKLKWNSKCIKNYKTGKIKTGWESNIIESALKQTLTIIRKVYSMTIYKQDMKSSKWANKSKIQFHIIEQRINKRRIKTLNKYMIWSNRPLPWDTTMNNHTTPQHQLSTTKGFTEPR